MPYPEMMVKPMREDLTRIGVQELTSADAVEQFFSETDGTAMLVINSVCGCAAGNCRPAVALSLQHEVKPDRVATVFAGQDTEATAAAREKFAELPPSSPSIVLIKDGEVFEYIPRHAIEGRDAYVIADDLKAQYEKMAE